MPGPRLGDVVSARTYLDAAGRFRDALDALGPYRGACGLCGHPDARHRQADAITGGLLAGDDIETVVAEYLEPALVVGAEVAATVAFRTLAMDHRLHALTRGRAADLDREVWAELAP